jgi:competence ComEA-like helix-hairpin-helix protein
MLPVCALGNVCARSCSKAQAFLALGARSPTFLAPRGRERIDPRAARVVASSIVNEQDSRDVEAERTQGDASPVPGTGPTTLVGLQSALFGAESLGVDTSLAGAANATLPSRPHDEPSPDSERPRSRRRPNLVASAETIDVNSASWAELRRTLPGVGEVLAKRIVAYRDQHGPFSDVSELARVPGFGATAVLRLTDRVRVVAPTREELLGAYPDVGDAADRGPLLDEAAAAYERATAGEGIFVERVSPVSKSMLPERAETSDPDDSAPRGDTAAEDPLEDDASASASADPASSTTSAVDSDATNHAPSTQGVFSDEVWEAPPPSSEPEPKRGRRLTRELFSREHDGDDLREERPSRSFVDATSLVPEPPSHLAIEPYRGPSIGNDADRDLLGTRLSDVRISELEVFGESPPLPPSEYDEPAPLSVSEPASSDLYVGGALFRDSRLPTTDAELRISLRDASERVPSLAETPAPLGVETGSSPSAAPRSSKRASQAVPVPAPAKQAANTNGWSQLAAVAGLALAIGLGGAWLGAKRAASNEVNRVSSDMIDVKTNVDTVRTDVDTLKDRVTALASATARTEQRFSEQELRNAAVDARLTKAEDDSRALEKTAKVVEEKAKRAEERSEKSAARLQKVEDEMTWQRMLTDSKMDSLRLRVRQAADDLESVAPRKQPKVATSGETEK